MLFRSTADGAVVTHQYQKKGNGSSKSYTVTLAISTVGVPQTWTGTRDVVVNP